MLNRLVDLGFFLDMAINFNLAYKDEGLGYVVVARKQVVAHYVKGWFALDLISLLPFGLIGELASSGQMTDMAPMRLVRMLRLVKLARLVRGLRLLTPLMMASNMLMR